MGKVVVREFGDPILRKKATAVSAKQILSKEIKTLEKSLLTVMRSTYGIGIAAPQIGVSKRVIVLESRPTPTRPNLEKRGPVIAINPSIISSSKNIMSDWEGCLSLPGVRGKVPRPDVVKIRYTDETGAQHTVRETGLWARMFQHEIDHLNGVFFTD